MSFTIKEGTSKEYLQEVPGSPGYSNEVAEEAHDLIDRAESEAHTGMHEDDPMSKSKKSSKGRGLESKSSGTSSSNMSSKAEGMKESMGKKMDSMKDTMGMKK
ncbi:hypothetical protein QBC34DRAFT_499462 [Podospora aff. communis PSN243]|uniref:Uncharacterized protein n=1 Tax=Podospora aff. communis PSN243 TaxID=3040156 RepID=A0AAV9G0J7_9PEZI|nr:hypothetical protein QBC34DRAFT_499462 [Podospora aff. communis PSN243]